MDEFEKSILPQLSPFVLVGSGDFHHLSAVFLRRHERPLTVVCFDNHPDCDIRPPRWSCGGWVNRALELPNVQRIIIWGCGNFELSMPSYLFANRRLIREARIEIHPWRERQAASVQRRFDCMSRENWRAQFKSFADNLGRSDLYVTVDLDCLDDLHIQTNWETGLFTPGDVAWEINRMRERTNIIGGDICGAYSAPKFERPLQKLADWWDHPKLPPVDPAAAQALNLKAVQTIWPVLTAGDQDHAEGD
jgi:arginase family enzyme